MAGAWQILVGRPDMVLDWTLAHLQMVTIACPIAIVLALQ